MPEALLQEGGALSAPVASGNAHDLLASAPRRFGLHAETSYILDCAVEFGDITPLEDLVFRVESPAAFALMELSERNEALPAHWLRNTARQYLDSLPLEERYVWALRGLPEMGLGMQLFCERVGYMVQTKVQSDLGIEERGFLAFLDEGTPAVFHDKVFQSVHDVTQARVESFVSAQYAEARARLESDTNFARQAVAWVQRSENRQLARSIAARLFKEIPNLPPGSQMQAVTTGELVEVGLATQRKNQRRARSAIKKALKLFSRTGLEDSVRLMVSGQEVELSHPDSPFKFVLQPLQAGWLEQKTVSPGFHVPYQLTLLTKEGVFLSRLCVLFDATPVLDQLLALTFFVQSGNEEDILSNANWFGYEDADTVRGILESKAPALLGKIPEPRITQQADGLLGFLSTPLHTEVHWAPFKGPVKNWIASWMGDLLTPVHVPVDATPVLS